MKKIRAFLARLRFGLKMFRRLLKEPYFEDDVPRPPRRSFFNRKTGAVVGVTAWFGSVIGLLFLGFVLFNVLFAGKELNLENLENGAFIDYDMTGVVSCESNSMGLTLDCHDFVYKKDVLSKGDLELGMIYTYEGRNGTSVLHRLVACVDTDCNLTVFKGDNNAVAELVSFENITHKVVRAEYR